MLNSYETILAVREAKGANKKVKILKENECKILKSIVEFACSPFITFGVRKFTLGEPLNHNRFDHNYEHMDKLLRYLAARSITGKKAKDAITAASINFNSQQQEVLTMILEKDLRCGVNAKTINKAFPELIPLFSCQLARKMEDMDKITFPCYAEVKKNGRRNIAMVTVDSVKHFSRNGKEQPNFSCFDEELIAIANGNALVFDGEVSGSAGDHTKQYKDAQKQARRKKDVDTKGLVFTVWDMLPIGDWKRKKCGLKLHERAQRLKSEVREYWKTFDGEPTVKSSGVVVVKDKKQLKKLYEKVLKQGHEGLIVKDMHSYYEYKRSKSWQKMKVENDIDLKIVDVVEGEKSWEGTLGAVVVKYKKNKVHCGLKGFTRKQAKKMWKNRKKLIGKVCEVQFMNESVTKNKKGKKKYSLYLPKMVEIRDDK